MIRKREIRDEVKEMRGRIIKSLLPLFLLSFSYANQVNYWSEGSSLGSNILSQYKNNLKGRVNNPIANGTKLYTLDNSQSGDVSITCSKEMPILKITYSTNGGGDININVLEDLDLNGNYEISFSVSGVSGICANGFIKCNSGTWNNCRFYELYFNGNNFYYKETSNSNLVQCYCINNSCGSLSSNSSAKILSDLGGAFASLIRNNYYIVSNVSVSRSYAYVYGKNINCGGESVPVGMDSTALQSKTEEIKNKDLNDKNSTYYLLNQTTENVNNNPVDKTFEKTLQDKQSSVKSSVSWDEGSNTYSYNDNGNKINGEVYVGNIENLEYCEIGYYETSSDVFGDKTNRANSTSSNKVQKTKIIECVKNGSNWICPVKSGQTIIHDCGKVNDFNRVAGALSAIDEAVKDLTCSTN